MILHLIIPAESLLPDKVPYSQIPGVMWLSFVWWWGQGERVLFCYHR